MKGARIPYSADEMAWLSANRMMVISDYTTAFNAEFDRDVSLKNLHGLRKRKGWLVGRTTKGLVHAETEKFSREEFTWLKENCTLVFSDYHREFCEKFQRTDVSARALNALRKRKGWRTGRTGQFAKGNEPWSKGKAIGSHPNSARTQFQKGMVRSGRAAEIYQPIGTVTAREDGYLQIKVRDDGPMPKRWRVEHLVRWEALHGPIPTGQCLKCLDGNRRNTDPANWELISRGVLATLNSGKRWNGLDHDAAEPELRPAILAIAKIKHAGRAKRRKVAA